MAAATPLQDDPLHVPATSVEATVEPSRVTYDEPESANMISHPAVPSQVPVDSTNRNISAITNNSSTTNPNNNSGGGIECANYFKNPTAQMMQRAKLEAMGGVLFVSLNCSHRGKFTLSETIAVGRILGGVRLDLSVADFVHPVTTITVGAILGGLRVTVPRGVRVEVHGFGILGSFRGLREGQTVHAGQEAPLVIVRGLTILAGVMVLVDESVAPIRIVE